VRGQTCHVIPLGRSIAMIELEHKGFRLAAVNAWMLFQVGEKMRVISPAAPYSALMCLSEVLLTIQPVVLSAVRRHTGETLRTPLSGPSILERKHGKRLHDSACAASLPHTSRLTNEL